MKMTLENKIIKGDCVEVMKTMPDNCVDMVFADPPYNLQINEGLKRPNESVVNGCNDDWDKFDSFAHYDEWSTKWLSEARRVLKPDGTLWVIGSYHNIFRVGTLLQNQGFWILNDIIWRKTNPMPNFRGTRFTNAHETLIWAAKSEKSKYVFNYSALKILNDDLQMRSDDWLFPLCTGSERLKNDDGNKIHSTQKPLALIARAILAATTEGDLILDPFCGTGTTAAAAKMLGRNYITIERETDYIKAAIGRLKETKRLENDALAITQSAKKAMRIPFGRIVEERLIKPGAKLYDISQNFSALVRADGSLICGRKAGSIHSLAASLLERESCNGWTFWHYLRKSKKLETIDVLRQKMRERLTVSA